MAKISIQNLKQMQNWAHSFAKKLSPPQLVLLKGDLGAGKTTFVRYIVEFFDMDLGQSPTYSLHNRYQNNKAIIDHFDLYRLESQEDLEASGFFDILAEDNNIVFVEWSERLDPAHIPLGRKLTELSIQIKGDSDERTVKTRSF